MDNTSTITETTTKSGGSSKLIIIIIILVLVSIGIGVAVYFFFFRNKSTTNTSGGSVAIGGSCIANSDCVSNNCSTTTNKCVAANASEEDTLLSNGEACSDDTNCKSTFCFDNVCSAVSNSVITDSMYSNSGLIINSSGPVSQLISDDTSLMLNMQGDGHLCIYPYIGGTALWCSDTNTDSTNAPYFAKMQSDGKLNIYNKNLTSVWSSNTINGVGPYFVKLQTDKRICIYDSTNSAIWCSAQL